jgi:hypothetical protein
MNKICLYNKDLIFNLGKNLFNHKVYKSSSKTLPECDYSNFCDENVSFNFII